MRSRRRTSSSTGRTWPSAGCDEAVYSERAIEIYEELGDLDRLAWVLNNLGGLAYLRRALGRGSSTLAERARDDVPADRRRDARRRSRR